MNLMSCFCLGISRRKPIKSPSSSFTINDLPLDILLEILYKLPVKQLHRNKIICKLWSSLISDPLFSCQYSTRATTPTVRLYLSCHHGAHLSCHDDAACIYPRSLTKHVGEPWSMERSSFSKYCLPRNSPWRPGQKYKCLGSSNGLLLCTKLSDPCHCLYYVCSPVTNRWVTLPSPPNCFKRPLSGLVFNLSSQVIKVVRIKVRTNSKDLKVEIFDSSSNQWKVHHKHTCNSVFAVSTEVTPTELQGILYWECMRNKLVFAFDTNVDRSHLIQLPTTIHKEHFHHGRLGVSKNHLYYAHVDFQYKDKVTYRIWRLGEDQIEEKPSWSLHLSSELLNDCIPEFQDCNLYNYSAHVLGIDPLDCNTVFLRLRFDTAMRYMCSIFSVDLGSGRMMRLYSSSSMIRDSYIQTSVTFLQPSWPITVPTLPPTSDLYKHIHRRTK